MFSIIPKKISLNPLKTSRDVSIRRENLEEGFSYLLHHVMSPTECRTLIAYAEETGFTVAGLAVGDDTYRMNLKARNNLRVILDMPQFASALWSRIGSSVDLSHEGAKKVGLNERFRIYKYESGHYFAPHVDIRTTLPEGETRFSFMIYLSEDFLGGETRFFEKKDKASRRGKGRARKFNNRLRYAVKPKTGAVVVFDHLLLHEGAPVTSGVKYAVRSDLVYQSS